MRSLYHEHEGFGFIVDVPEIRALVEETRRLIGTIGDHGDPRDGARSRRSPGCSPRKPGSRTSSRAPTRPAAWAAESARTRLPRRRRFTVPVFPRRSGWRGDAGARPPGVGAGGGVPGRAARHDLRTPRRRDRSRACDASDVGAADLDSRASSTRCSRRTATFTTSGPCPRHRPYPSTCWPTTPHVSGDTGSTRRQEP